MQLMREERDIIEGKKGNVLQKVLQTLFIYGKAVGAEKFVDVEGPGHLVIPSELAGIGPRQEMLEELVNAGLKTKFPFTIDPKPPLDFENYNFSDEQMQEFHNLYSHQREFDKLFSKLGVQGSNAYTCTCYLPEVGNIPKKGTILAWAESSAVVFANSVLGARTNRNGAIIDLLSNIAGKTPLFGLLTEEGRKASWLIKVTTLQLPNPQLLGATIGRTVEEDIPYITGLDKFLGSGVNSKTVTYLKEMGAACASIGAVGLYHVENITPEAQEFGTNLLKEAHQTLEIDDEMLNSIFKSYSVQWKDPKSHPKRCLIGCPHLSLDELYWWTKKICNALHERNQQKVAIETTLCAASPVLRKFKENQEVFSRLMEVGIKLSSACSEATMTNQFCSREAVVTNSNKLHHFTTARMYLDDGLVKIIVSGELPTDATGG